MPFATYTSYDPSTGKELGFQHSFERIAALQLAKMLWRTFGKSPTHNLLLVNLERPPMDAVLVSENGIGLLDFKDYNNQIKGDEETAWMVFDSGTTAFKPLQAGSHVNPFQQVKDYRRRLYSRLKGYAQSNPRALPVWMSNPEDYYLQAAVVFTASRFDLQQIRIAPAHRWFSMRWLETIPEWVYSLNFGHGHALKPNQMETLAKDVLELKPWTEIAGHLQSQEPYAYLWLILNGVEALPMALDQDEAVIGRAPDISLSLGNSDAVGLASRRHARFIRRGQRVLVEDIGSSHGTWINGTLLPPGQQQELASGDRIVLGKNREDGTPDHRSAEVIFRRPTKQADITASAEIP